MKKLLSKFLLFLFTVSSSQSFAVGSALVGLLGAAVDEIADAPYRVENSICQSNINELLRQAHSKGDAVKSLALEGGDSQGWARLSANEGVSPFSLEMKEATKLGVSSIAREISYGYNSGTSHSEFTLQVLPMGNYNFALATKPVPGRAASNQIGKKALYLQLTEGAGRCLIKRNKDGYKTRIEVRDLNQNFYKHGIGQIQSNFQILKYVDARYLHTPKKATAERMPPWKYENIGYPVFTSDSDRVISHLVMTLTQKNQLLIEVQTNMNYADVAKDQYEYVNDNRNWNGFHFQESKEFFYYVPFAHKSE